MPLLILPVDILRGKPNRPLQVEVKIGIQLAGEIEVGANHAMPQLQTQLVIFIHRLETGEIYPAELENRRADTDLPCPLLVVFRNYLSHGSVLRTGRQR